MHGKPKTKPITWVGSSLKDMREMPEDVRDVFGKALFMAQLGIATPKEEIDKIKARLKQAEELHRNRQR